MSSSVAPDFTKTRAKSNGTKPFMNAKRPEYVARVCNGVLEHSSDIVFRLDSSLQTYHLCPELEDQRLPRGVIYKLQSVLLRLQSVSKALDLARSRYQQK